MTLKNQHPPTKKKVIAYAAFLWVKNIAAHLTALFREGMKWTLPIFTKIARENPHRFDSIYLERWVVLSWLKMSLPKGIEKFHHPTQGTKNKERSRWRSICCEWSFSGLCLYRLKFWKVPTSAITYFTTCNKHTFVPEIQKKHRTFLCTFLFSDPKDHSFSINYKCNLRGVAPEKSMMRSLVPWSRSLETVFPALGQRQPNKTFASKGIPYSFGEGFLAAEWGRCFLIPTSSQTKKLAVKSSYVHQYCWWKKSETTT